MGTFQTSSQIFGNLVPQSIYLSSQTTIWFEALVIYNLRFFFDMFHTSYIAVPVVCMASTIVVCEVDPIGWTGIANQ